MSTFDLITENSSPSYPLSQNIQMNDCISMKGCIQSLPYEDLRWAFNICSNDFENIILHLVFQRNKNTSGSITVTSRINGEWTGKPGWKFNIPDFNLNDFMIKAYFNEDGIDIYIDNNKLNTAPIPYGKYHINDINKIILSGQWGRVLCKSLEHKTSIKLSKE